MAASPDEQINAKYVGLICSVAALGGLLFGYDWVVIGGAKPFYEAYFQLTSSEQIGWANSCALLGCLLGSLFSGGVSDRFGRKRLLILAAFLFGVSSLLAGLAQSFGAFVFWRIFGGVAIGIASNVSPTYIAEVSPAMWRGRLVSLNQMTIVIGILLAQIVNRTIAESVPEGATVAVIRASWNGQWGWRWMFIAVVAPSVLFFVSSLFVPESPRWLAMRREMDMRGQPSDPMAVRGPIRGFKAALLIGVTLAVLQQWSGINILFNYAQEVYQQAGYGVNDILFNIVITGAVNLLFTLVAFRVVDKWGRRPLMLFGCASIAISHALIALAYSWSTKGLAVLVFTLLTIGCYAMSLAPVTWVIIAEIFPARTRGRGVALSVSALWIASFLLTFTFPILQERLGVAGVFWLYAGICTAGFFFVQAKVPETKGKTLEEIEAGLGV